jgi:HK97 family phage prohead protease
MDLERRAAVELRSSGRRLEGYAAVFEVPTRIGTFTEIVARGAFTRSLAAGGDVLCLVDHDPRHVLARTKAGTLRLGEDSRGLHFETSELPGTSWANDALELVRSGNAGGASFAFRVGPGGERWRGNKRTLTGVDLQEVSVVAAWPAYEGTAVSTRRKVPPRLALALRVLATV